jgi:hypothetical protein
MFGLLRFPFLCIIHTSPELRFRQDPCFVFSLACSQQCAGPLFGINSLSAMIVIFHLSACNFFHTGTPDFPSACTENVTYCVSAGLLMCSCGVPLLPKPREGKPIALFAMHAGSREFLGLDSASVQVCLPHRCVTHTHARARGWRVWMVAYVLSPSVSWCFIGS